MVVIGWSGEWRLDQGPLVDKESINTSAPTITNIFCFIIYVKLALNVNLPAI